MVAKFLQGLGHGGTTVGEAGEDLALGGTTADGVERVIRRLHDVGRGHECLSSIFDVIGSGHDFSSSSKIFQPGMWRNANAVLADVALSKYSWLPSIKWIISISLPAQALHNCTIAAHTDHPPKGVWSFVHVSECAFVHSFVQSFVQSYGSTKPNCFERFE